MRGCQCKTSPGDRPASVFHGEDQALPAQFQWWGHHGYSQRHLHMSILWPSSLKTLCTFMTTKHIRAPALFQLQRLPHWRWRHLQSSVHLGKSQQVIKQNCWAHGKSPCLSSAPRMFTKSSVAFSLHPLSSAQENERHIIPRYSTWIYPSCLKDWFFFWSAFYIRSPRLTHFATPISIISDPKRTGKADPSSLRSSCWRWKHHFESWASDVRTPSSWKIRKISKANFDGVWRLQCLPVSLFPQESSGLVHLLKKSEGFCLSRQGQQGQRYLIHQDSSSPKDSGPCLEKSSQKASTEFVAQSRPRRQAATTLGAKRCWKLHQCHLVM
jgi:hypothetical protein